MAYDGLHREGLLLVEYDDSSHLHERRILAFIDSETLLVATPHWDIYEERMDSYSACYQRGPRGGLPKAWAQKGSKVVVFKTGDWERRSVDELRKARDEYPSPRHGSFTAIKSAEENASSDDGADGAVVFQASKQGGPARPPRPPGVENVAAAARRSDEVWIAMETRHGYTVGAPVDTSKGKIHAHGDRATLVLAEGSLALAQTGSFEPPVDDGDDLRTLQILYDRGGSRSRTFLGSVPDLSESSFDDWRISGPRTTLLWLSKAIAGQDTSFLRRHDWWRSTMRLAEAAEGVTEHGFLSNLLETALVYDGLNISQLACMELASRRYQYWEQHYQDTLRDGEAGSSGGKSFAASERGLFLGEQHSRATALVCPHLQEHVSSSLKDEASLLKERRKAREER